MPFFGDRKKKAILIVDDDVSVRTMLGMLFQSQEYEVLEASSGDQGVRLAIERLPDAIILDVMLPQMSGFEVLGLLRADEKLAKTPIVMCTARDTLDDVERCLSAGANDYIQKPFDLKTVLWKMQKLISPAQP